MLTKVPNSVHGRAVIGSKFYYLLRGWGVTYLNLDRAQEVLWPAEVPYWALCVLSPLLINRTVPVGCIPLRGVRGRVWFKGSSRWERDKAATGLLFLWCTSKLSRPSLRVEPVHCGLGREGASAHPAGDRARAKSTPEALWELTWIHWEATPIMEGKVKLQWISSSQESVEDPGKVQWKTQIIRPSSIQEILLLFTYSSSSVRDQMLHQHFPQGDLNKSYLNNLQSTPHKHWSLQKGTFAKSFLPNPLQPNPRDLILSCF